MAQPAKKAVLHQGALDSRYAQRVTTTVSAPPANISGTYTQAEVTSLRATVAEMRSALKAAGLIDY